MPANYIEIILRIDARTARRNKEQVKTMLRDIERSAGKMGASVEGAMKQGERGTRGLIRSAIDLQVAMQTTSRVADQLGTSLRNAASGAAIKQAYANLTKFSDIAGDKLLKSMQRAAKGTAATLDLMRIANRAMLAGGEELASQIPRLFEIARAASIASGQDISYVFDTLVKGIVKGSYLLIDNAEIYIRIGQAVREYADSLGVATEDLTFHERQMGILNAVLREGDEFVEKIGSDVEVATDVFDRWSAKIKDAKQNIGELVNKFGPLGPILVTTADLFQSAAPLLTVYILLKQQAAAASVQHTAALTAETAALQAQAIAGKESAAAILARGAAQGAAATGTGLQLGAALFSPTGALAAVGGVAAGVLVYEKAVRRLNPRLASTSRILGYVTKRMFEGADAARLWAENEIRLERGMLTVEQANQKRARQLEQFLGTLGQGEEAYKSYVRKVQEFNATLKGSEQAIAIVSPAIFDFNQMFEHGALSVQEQIDKLEDFLRLVSTLPPIPFIFPEGMAGQAFVEDLEGRLAELRAERAKELEKEQEEALKVVTDTLRDSGLEADALRGKIDALGLATGELTREDIELRNSLELLADGFSVGAVKANDMLGAVQRLLQGEQLANEGYLRTVLALEGLTDVRKELTDIEIQQIAVNRQLERSEQQLADSLEETIGASQRRADKDRVRAAQDLSKRIEQINSRHAQRVEDIERNHRRRLQDIDREYTKTVEQAIIDRDALAILHARETRDEQTAQAELDRGDALRAEQVSYQDSINQAQAAYQERLARIQESLNEEIQREREAHQQELDAQKSFFTQQLADLKQQHLSLETAELQHQVRMAQIRGMGRRTRSGGQPRGGRGGVYYEQHGGSGVVTGPATFKVEPGVTEAYWFSGAFGRGGASPVPGQATQPATQNVNVNVGGRVDFSGLPERLADLLSGQLGQMVLDNIGMVFAEEA